MDTEPTEIIIGNLPLSALMWLTGIRRRARCEPAGGAPPRSPTRKSRCCLAMDAARIRELLGDGSAEGRAAALAALEGGPTDAALAVECVSPLAELLRMPAAEVDAAEFRRVGLLVAQLVNLHPTVAAAWVQDCTFACAWTSGNAMDLALAKPLEELTREDLLTAAAGEHYWSAFRTRGVDPVLEQIGMSFHEILGAIMTHSPHRQAKSPDDARNMRLVTLAMEVLSDDDAAADLHPLERGGVWAMLQDLGQPRPAVQLHAVRCGAVSTMVSELGSGAKVLEAAATTTLAMLGVVSGCIYGAPAEVKTLAAATPGFLDLVLDVLRVYAATDSPDTHGFALYEATLFLSELLSYFPQSDRVIERLRGEVRKTHLLRHCVVLNMIVSPRQARDTHWESTQKERCVFSAGEGNSLRD